MEKDYPLIEAVAESWASIDGHLDQFRRDKDIPLEDGSNEGRYDGYMAEAEELITRLKARGFDVCRT